MSTAQPNLTVVIADLKKMVTDSRSYIDTIEVRNRILQRVVLYSTDFIPYQTGKLQNSIKIQNGVITQDVPYAARLYFAEEDTGGAYNKKKQNYEYYYSWKRRNADGSLSRPRNIGTGSRTVIQYVSGNKNGFVFSKDVHKSATSHWFDCGTRTHEQEMLHDVQEIMNEQMSKLFASL